MGKRFPPKERERATLRELGESVMDIVATVAGRRLTQALELVHEEFIEPRDRRIAELEAEVKRLGGKL